MTNNMGIPGSPPHSPVSEIVVEVGESPGSRTPEGMNRTSYVDGFSERFPQEHSGSCLPLKSACRSLWKGLTDGQDVCSLLVATGSTVGVMALIAAFIYWGVKGELEWTPSPNAN
jgi:hypothetical protein